MILGIDEAGRGPVIGPMVLAGVLVDKEGEEKLKKIGVKDSKLLLKGKRERLYKEIIEIAKSFEIIIVHPKEIDEALDSTDLNLNWLEAHKSALIINKLKPNKVIIDCPHNNIPVYQRYIEKLLSHKAEIVLEHKADVNHPVCSAASILAKVTRDEEIAKIQSKVGEDIGSGYPSDPTTQRFLKKNFDKYPFFRKSWICWQVAKDMNNQAKLDDFKTP